jgi:hypothetical protein
MNATAWPLVVHDRCEGNYVVVPGIGEFWSAVTGLLIAAGGWLSLVTSKYSDDVMDLVSATIVVNGLSSALAHGTLLRVFGQIDSLSINIGALLYIKAILMSYNPLLAAEPVA